MLGGLFWFWILLFSPKALVKCEPNWTFDLISVEVENKTPNIVNIQAEITRPRRGVFGLSAVVDIKEDLTDENHIRAVSFYSLTGSSFVRTPFAIPEANFSAVMNTYYKEYVMESFLNCSDNSPRIVDKFAAPLTKRVVLLKDCIISNNNLPPVLRSGYYKLNFWYSNYAEGSIEFLIKVEQK